MTVNVLHAERSGQEKLIGAAEVDLSAILHAPLKETPQSMVRVSDAFLAVK